MNSTEPSLWTCVEPNVEAVFGDGGASALDIDNNFLAFRAARAIGAFEELVWRYCWADDEAQPQPPAPSPAAAA